MSFERKLAENEEIPTSDKECNVRYSNTGNVPFAIVLYQDLKYVPQECQS